MADVEAPAAASLAMEQSSDNTALVAAPSVVVAPPAEKKMVKKVVRRKRRPARAQIDASSISHEPPPQTGTIFNIWYNKWSGGDRDTLQQAHARGRCNIVNDSGYTRADQVAGSYFCLRFARGLCPLGQDCDYLHRLPTVYDLFSPNVDCFGREKFSDYRDDMGGVGSFMRQNRTVYVGRVHVTEDIEETVARHFAEWGQIERIRVLNTRGVGFITYTNEANAQFAREAMMHQSLDHDEVLNVRWATADPNPMAQKREARRVEEQAAEAIRRALPAEFVAEIEGKDPEARKRRRIESSYGLPGYEAPDEVHFARGPNAINPVGRIGFEPVQQETRMIEAAGEPSVSEDAGNVAMAQGGENPQAADGIFSSRTLAALQGARVSVAQSKPKEEAAGPLVGYGSDSDDDDD